MNDGLPTEEQLRRIEQGVLTRIRRRAELPKRIATGVAIAAVFAGGAFLLPRFGLSGGGSGSSGGSGGSTAYQRNGDTEGRSAAAGSAALLAECHGSASAASPVHSVPLAEDSTTAALKACVLAFERGQVPTASGGSNPALKGRPTAKDLVVCRDAGGRLQVFVKDARPSTLCARNGMKAP
jgi:hypothetical protein